MNEGFDGNTLLLECEDNEYAYISGSEVFEFETDDKTIDYISLMGNNFVPYAIIIGEKYTYFVAHHYKLLKTIKLKKAFF